MPSTISLQGSREKATSSVDNPGGIGISEFLGAKNFLITGGTGFLAKVLIEKILRTNADVGKIYVVTKARDTAAAMKRLQKEVVGTELFKCLQQIHGTDYNSFVERKLVPVAGDISSTNLGIVPELANEIAEQVDVIVNSAGNTNFHERYDVAMDINTLGAFRIMSFAHNFRRLKLFLHVSTAYVNGERQGVALEKPFCLGDTISSEPGSSEYKTALLDIENEIKLAFNSRRHSDGSQFHKEMKDLGLQRAKLYGWQDTYVLTKAMGEMVINSIRGEIPVVIIRPSIIESTMKEPFPGWIQGSRMVDPVVLGCGKGLIRSFLGDPDCILDVIPVDMVVNTMLATIAKHATQDLAAGMHVYHVASSTVNPLTLGDTFMYINQHFKQSPLIDKAGNPIVVQPIQLLESMEQFQNALLQSSKSAASSEKARESRAIKQIINLGRIYEPYTFYGGRFDTTNTDALHAEMSLEEKAMFQFDVRCVNWMDYFCNKHIPGLKKHVLKVGLRNPGP
ncbi:hypothetical protein QOZ80_5BG0431860 [Eleusine coracana subsp. coracana]|nr:hypothetical protein QOZ80_5BG0431860 [Eleusine coracana subsp. coracana]